MTTDTIFEELSGTADRGATTHDEPAGSVWLVDQLLRDRRALLRRIEAGEDLAALARTMLVTIVVACAVAGAAMGYYRGGVQTLFAAIKLPLAILLTAGITAPAFSAMRAVILGDSNFRRDTALVLSSLALCSLFIAGLSPLVLLAVLQGVGYHTMIMLVFATASVGALAGLWFFVNGLRGPNVLGRLAVGAFFLTTVFFVGAQMTWTLRPYVVRPRTVEIPVVRSLEGSFYEAVSLSASSMLGIYWREAPADPSGRSLNETRDHSPGPHSRPANDVERNR